jgi:hypothetical protein
MHLGLVHDEGDDMMSGKKYGIIYILPHDDIDENPVISNADLFDEGYLPFVNTGGVYKRYNIVELKTILNPGLVGIQVKRLLAKFETLDIRPVEIGKKNEQPHLVGNDNNLKRALKKYFTIVPDNRPPWLEKLDSKN